MSRILKITPIIILLIIPHINLEQVHSDDNEIVVKDVVSSKPIETSLDYSEEHFGDQQLFWILLPEFVQMRATLLAVGNWCYVYMANETIDLYGESLMISKCETLRDEFDTTIYPKAIEIAGSPDGYLGDIDGDPHVTIFLAPLCRYYGSNSHLGYYDVVQDYPSQPYSNAREMVYVDSEKKTSDCTFIIVHEFNHLIWMNHEQDESNFLMEGGAQYAVDYSGYYSWVTDAIADTYTYYPELSLLYFVREYGTLWDACYGQAYIFMTYLAERFGDDFVKVLVSIAEDAALAIDYALTYFGYDLTFNDIYLDWITACVIDEPSIYGGIYGFQTVDYKIQAHVPIGLTFPIEKSNRIHYYYGFEVKSIYTDSDNFTFTVDNPYPFALGISVVIEDESGWNVTTALHHKNSDKISIYIEGNDISEAYIITSLMRSYTPTEYGIIYSLDELVSVELSYVFTDGAITSQVEESNYNYIVSLLAFPAIYILQMMFNRRRKLLK